MTIPIIGYTDTLSAHAGGRFAVKVSSALDAPFHADLVRIRSADPNPEGPGIRYEQVRADFAGTYPSRVQPVHSGSCGTASVEGMTLGDTWTIAVRVQPWRLGVGAQAVLSLDGTPGLVLGMTETGTVLRIGSAQCQVPAPPHPRRWYELRLVAAGGQVRLTQTPLDGQYRDRGEAELAVDTARITPRTVLFAAEPGDGASPYRSHFDGRIEHPFILAHAETAAIPLRPEACGQGGLLAWWDFSLDIPDGRISDRGRSSFHGHMINQPTRAVRGSNWTGEHMNWPQAPDGYAAVHFHSDDLLDCGWETDFIFDVPMDFPSGIYGIRLRASPDGGPEDVIPVFVLPPPGQATARVALLLPTYTYQVYANYDRENFDDAFRARMQAWGSYPHHPGEHKQFGLSTYDHHADGSGVAFSSHLRPILTMRPGYIAYVDHRGSGLRHFPADMHLAAWLDASGIAFDVLTDHDLEREGATLLQRYTAVLTGTHPEYQSLGTLNATRDYVASGGHLAYLGGNGYYWRVAASEKVPGTLELRRAESGTRAWAAEPGEYYHALDGSYGGLWRRNGRPPQMLVGVGFSAQGRFEGSYYRRLPASRDKDIAWMFEGIEGEVIGDFGFSGGGAAGFELDRADPLLGSPPNTRILCRSEKHQSHFGVTPEELLAPAAYTGLGQQLDALIRAEIVYFTVPGGGSVFSTGSITFCGSLPWNNFDNQVSTLLRNVIGRFLSR